MNSPRCFTIEEANALLPELKPLMAGLLERRAKSVHLSRQSKELLQDTASGVGGPAASQLTQEFIVMEQMLGAIRAHGCVIKSIDAGLVDFLSKRDGRYVYLCWRYGEPQVEHYHELHRGFSDRRRI